MTKEPMHARVLEGAVLFGRFRLDKKLGEGGMGEVWSAHDGVMEQPVALKFVSQEYLGDARALLLLKREAQKARVLTHPNIVRVHDFHEEPGLACISMEYVEGETLQSVQRREANKVFQPGLIADLVAQLCEALHYAHETVGMIHRDLKPANLMVDRRRQLRVMDFGIAAPQPTVANAFTRSLASSGTLPYMSPQQLQGAAPSPKDDLYSLGATLYEMFTGAPPFYKDDIPHDILYSVPPPIRQRREEFGLVMDPIAPVWETVIAQCLAKDPARRPKSARELLARLSIHRTMPARAVPAAAPNPVPPRVEQVVAANAASDVGDGDDASPSFLSRLKSTPVLAVVAIIGLGIWTATRPDSTESKVVPSRETAETSRPVAATNAEPRLAQAPAATESTPVARTEPRPPEPALPVHLEIPDPVQDIFSSSGSDLVLVDRGRGRVLLVTPAPEVAVREITLRRAPEWVSFAAEARRLYCAYNDGLLTYVSTETGADPRETEFAHHPAPPVAILAMDYGLLVADKVGAWGSLTSYPESGGRMTATREWFIAPRFSLWDSRNHRAYFLSYEHSPRDIAYEEITSSLALGKKGDSPYHDSTGMDGPIYLLDRFIGLGSGRLFDPVTLTLMATLPFEAQAGLSIGDLMFVADRPPSKIGKASPGPGAPTYVHRVGARGEDEASIQMPGRFIGMCPWAGTLAVATDLGARTRIFFLDEGLSFVEPPPPRAEDAPRKPVIVIKRSGTPPAKPAAPGP